jgi:hypothetical protein
LDIAPQGELSAYFDFHNTSGEEAHYLIYNPDDNFTVKEIANSDFMQYVKDLILV